MTHVFAISGSLRKVSTNTALVQRYAELSRTICTVDVYDQLELLPPFNPDIEETTDGIVLDFVARVRTADAFVVATPEYAHGLPGALKNSLDWLVGTDAFIDKPFAILTACPRSKHAPASLLEILKTMSGIHVAAADVTVNLNRNPDEASTALSTADASNRIRDVILAMDEFCRFPRELHE